MKNLRKIRMQTTQQKTAQNKKDSVFQDILKRAIFGALFLVLTIGAIIWSPYAWAILAAFYSMGCLYEFTEKDPNAQHGKWIIRTAAVMIWMAVFVFMFTENILWLSSVIFIVPIIFFSTLFSHNNQPFAQSSAFLLSLFYTVLPFISLVFIGILLEDGVYHFELILWLFLLIWSNDSFAYLAGRMFGKNKMAPHISPGKSWEGFAGGAIMTLALSFAIAHWFIPLNFVFVFFMVMLVIPIAVLGDLVESKWKRSLEIKDSGNFLPGHGGFLDRFDSILISAPIIFCYFYALKSSLF